MAEETLSNSVETMNILDFLALQAEKTNKLLLPRRLDYFAHQSLFGTNSFHIMNESSFLIFPPVLHFLLPSQLFNVCF